MAPLPLYVDVLRADGTEDRVALSSRSRIMVERKWPNAGKASTVDGQIVLTPEVPPHDGTLFALWVTECKPAKPLASESEEAFLEYVDTITAWADVPTDDDAADPSPPAAGETA